MRCSILTICPEQFGDFRRSPVIARAEASGKLSLEILDIREGGLSVHGSILAGLLCIYLMSIN